MDQTAPFSKLVEVEDTVRVGQRRRVGSVQQAARLLLTAWPEKGRGPRHRHALRACLAVLEGRGDVAAARFTFIAAAKEAGLFVREVGPLER